MLHPINIYAVSVRLESIRANSKTEQQLKREGYREFREPRIPHHWANR